MPHSKKPDFSFWNKNAFSYGEEMKDDLQTRNVDETKRSHQMTCYNCNGNLIWGGDHDLEDDEEHTILTNLSCPSCRAQVLVYWGNKTEQEEWNEEETNRRMDIIGQNGNDGLHYDEVEEERNGVNHDKDNEFRKDGMYK